MSFIRNAATGGRVAATLLSVALLGGCQQSGYSTLAQDPEGVTVGSSGANRANLAGPRQVLDPQAIEKVDLLTLVDPINRGGSTVALSVDEEKNPQISVESRMLAKAYENFYSYPNPKARRNSIQDTIIGASDQRCNVFKVFLQRNQSENNFWTGSFATALGGAGAIFTSANVARTFSGLSGIVSGVGAEFNQAYYANLTVSVIVQGIDAERQRIREDIARARATDHEATQYTVQAAIADAIRYHAACSIITGLSAASESIRMVSNPGLNEAIKVAGLTRKLAAANDPKTTLAESEQSLALVANSGQVFGQSLKVKPESGPAIPAQGIADATLGLRSEATKLQEAIQKKTAGLDAAKSKAVIDALGQLKTTLTTTFLTKVGEADAVFRACDQDLGLTAKVATEKGAAEVAPLEDPSGARARLSLAVAKAELALLGPVRTFAAKAKAPLASALDVVQKLDDSSTPASITAAGTALGAVTVPTKASFCTAPS
jgi:hypothetical protein